MYFNTTEVKWPSPFFGHIINEEIFFQIFMDFWSEFESLICRCCLSNVYIFLFRYGWTVPVDLDLLIVEVSKSYSIRRTTICMTPGDAWTANRRHIYIITHISHTHTNTHTHTHKRQAFMTPAGFKPATRGAGESPRLRPRGHWEGPYVLMVNVMLLFFVILKFLELALRQSA